MKSPVVAIWQAEWPMEGPIVKPPNPKDTHLLVDHYKKTQHIRCVMSYDEQMDRCGWCLALGKEYPRGNTRRLRWCTPECMEGYAAYIEHINSVMRGGGDANISEPASEEVVGETEGRPDEG